MAASQSAPPPPPPPKALSDRGGAHISLFLDTDVGTHLALNVAAESTIRALKSQVAMEHADAFPDLGPVVVNSFQVLRKGAMYHLSDSMPVRSAFAKVKAGYFLHVKMAAVETGTHYCRDEDRGKSSDKLPQMLKGGEDAGAWVTVHAHDVHPCSSSQQKTERKSTAGLVTDVQTISVSVTDKSESYNQWQKHRDQTEGVYVNSTSVANINGLTNQNSVALVGTEVHTREEDLPHSVGDRELGFISGEKQVGTRENSQEKDCDKSRVTGSFDISAVDPSRETNDSKTRDSENFDKLPPETNTNTREVLSNACFQQEVDGNIKEDSIQVENPILTGKNKKRKKSWLVTSKDVSAPEMAEPSTAALEVPKATGEDLLHENQGLQGDVASNVEMTGGDKTKVIPADMRLSSSQLNSGSQVTKQVQLGTDAQATSDLAADQGSINLVYEGCRNPIVGDISISTCKVAAGEEKSAKGTSDRDSNEIAVDASNMEKGSKSEDVLETLDNISQEKNYKQSKVSSVGLTSMDTAEAKDQCGFGENTGNSDIIATRQEIVNDPSKRQTASNVQQGIENPNGDVNRKKKRRRHPESSKDGVTQEEEKPSGSIMNASSTQITSSLSLDAKQIALGNIGEEKDECRREKVAEPSVSTHGVSVNVPSNMQQGDSDVIKNSNGDRKRRKKKKRHLESGDPLKAEQTTAGTVGEATVSDCRKVDETVGEATVSDCRKVDETNVINDVLADLRCTDNLSKVLSGDPLTELTKGGPALPPSAIQSDPPIISPSHKSKGKQVKIPSTVRDPSHSSVGAPDKFHDLKDVLAESTVVPADGRTKSTKRQKNKVSLNHVPTDSGKAIQSLGEQVSHVPEEDLKGENCTKAELFQGGSATDAPSSTGQILQKKSKRSSKAQASKLEESDHSTHGHVNQFAKDSQDKYVTDIGGTLNNENTVGAPTESPIVHKDGTTVTCDKPNVRKARKKSAKTELRSQDTNLEHGSDADFMNSRAQQGAVIPEAVEPNDQVPIQPDNNKINFIDHFSPSVTNDPTDSAKNNEERGVKGKKKRKRKADTQSQHAGSILPNDLLESHVHTDKTSLADHFGTGNVGVPSVSSENMSKEDGNVKKAKEKKKSKQKPDLFKPESLNPNGGNQDTVNCTQDLMHSVVQPGRMEQGNAKENIDKIIQNDSMLQQETEDATHGSTLEKKAPQSMIGVDSQTNFPIKKDHARMSKDQKNSNSQTKPHAKSRKHDASIDGRNPNAVSNLLQSSSMSPQASNESAYGTPSVHRFRVAVRKVPRKMYEQVKDKPKKDVGKKFTGTIFDDTISESSDEVLDTMSEKLAMGNSSSTSADSGISSADGNGSDVPDDDDIVSFSQKSNLHSVLQGSTSYKKARLKPTELLDDTEVPDSQPPI
uniref:Uncharacterized protein n=1 Tax=Avena sativa TaxID=4498 RepID=A0ACD5URN8_AVESA